ncbi:hypothetical protein [Picosynechococcus sp. NKBG15041c]|uniref:hypothetical protein n=1 Tax=Picosynechococcus sp. NKBG15041c TaxID=1407650 RepID=UPI0003FF5BD7|nr:hypothetical protein [Picosynechococcus sp. NKBG15041c]
MMKFKSSAIALGTIIAFGAIGQAAQAGESYVSNTWTNSNSQTKTNLYMYSNEWSHGSRDWANYAYKEYYDGAVSTIVDGSFESDIALNGTFDGTVDGTVIDGENAGNGAVDFYVDDFSGETEGTIALNGTSTGFADNFTTTTDYDGFTFHTALAVENGTEEFGSSTTVFGTINSIINSVSNSHETAAGNR